MSPCGVAATKPSSVTSILSGSRTVAAEQAVIVVSPVAVIGSVE